MTRKLIPISLVVPDASPLLSLGSVERLDVLSHFTRPVHVVDVVLEEAQRPQNDRNGAVRRWWDRRPNNVTMVSTLVGDGLAARRARGETPPSGNLGEVAVDEYATRLARTGDAKNVPLVLFEDPDVLELRIARLRNVHLLNTAAFLIGLRELGVMDDGQAVLDRINALRKTPMRPIERPARTRRHQSMLAAAVRRAEGGDA